MKPMKRIIEFIYEYSKILGREDIPPKYMFDSTRRGKHEDHMCLCAPKNDRIYLSNAQSMTHSRKKIFLHSTFNSQRQVPYITGRSIIAASSSEFEFVSMNDNIFSKTRTKR